MLSFFFLAAAPLLACAYQQEQTPLIDHGPEFVVPLKLDERRNYFYQSKSNAIRHIELQRLEGIIKYGAADSYPQVISVHVPSDLTLPGSMSVTTLDRFASSQLNWIDTKSPGLDIPVSHVGVRKGGAISEEIYAVRLVPESPYIAVPEQIYDILALATEPKTDTSSLNYDSIVDCSKISRFPDLFVGLDPQDEFPSEEDAVVEDREIIITPSQYVMETEPGRCVLLVTRHHHIIGSEEVILGWAAFRGKHIVLDWANQRTGFGI